MKAIRFTKEELDVVSTALAIWEATPGGGDLSEVDKRDLAEACRTARAKVAAANNLPPPPASVEG